MPSLMEIIAPESHMEIVWSLSNDMITTYNVNIREKTFGNIKFHKDLGHALVKNEVKIMFQGNKATKRVCQASEKILIPNGEGKG